MNPPAVKILLVDDDVRNLDVLESILDSAEWELVRALTADQALMLLLADEYAVIVLDIKMPGMSGLELAGLIKQRRRTQHTPIIFLTAYFQEDKDVLQGYGSGAVDYLTKPINPQILRSKIAVFVDVFRKTKALEESNRALELENARRLGAEEALRRVNGELEARVHERTADLLRLNEELRAREAALRSSEAQARAASRAKDDFLAALSHELRTPLNPVLLLSSAAASDPGLPQAARDDFEMIRQNIDLEARLIDDLLDLTRITRGKLPLQLETVDLHAAARNALAIVRSDIEESGLTLKLDLAAPEHRVRGDAVRLQQVCWNILKNAVKFTPKGGTITIATHTEAEKGEVTLQISDTGIGLTADKLGGIFEAFAQGDHSVKNGPHRFGGLGLGLAISRTLVEMHGGRVQASSPGRDHGATFAVILPLAGVRAGTDQPAPTRPEGAAGAGRRLAASPRPGGRRSHILLVEDHSPTRSALVHLLGRRGYDVTVAGTAAEARARILECHPDLLISDIGLPDGGGCELLQELRACQPGLSGIALSGYGMDEDIARSRLAGFVEHITKPVSMDALDAAILAVLNGLSDEVGRARSEG